MPIPARYQQELQTKYVEAEREARRESRGDLLRTIGHIVFWTLAGLFLWAMAFHVLDLQIAMIYWYAGGMVWLGGVLFSILAAYRRGERRGDW